MAEQEVAGGRGQGHRKVKSLDPKIFGEATPAVQELTVDDLNRLAEVASGSAQAEGPLAELTTEDIRSLDDAFAKAKLEAADQLGGKLGQQGVSEEIFDNWSCCCCTPCCCCASADVDPFE
jgi:hypothetical protein